AEAARYYMHPLGDVLRGAAPALPQEALRLLERRGALERGGELRGRRVAQRMVTSARRTELSAAGIRLGEKQRAVLAQVEAREQIELPELEALIPGGRSAARRLELRGLLALQVRPIRDAFFEGEAPQEQIPELTEAQRHACEAILPRLGEGGGFLLHGVTGSGKTEVYLRIIAEARVRGLGALLLVPEISLTPQLVSRFRARFGDDIAVLHSGLSERRRDRAWRGLRSGELRIAIGARSALFSPIQQLGVIVVDEEHDSSFKQEEGFRYHARDMALLRAHRAGAVCVLGSATPSVESYHLAEEGRLRLLRMPERATPHALPAVEIVDLGRHRHGPSGSRMLSGPLHAALEGCLEAQGQAILFLNRRGFAPALRCTACEEILQCPACSVSLTEHRRAGRLRCHYCDYHAPPGDRCPHCGAEALERLGLGTEQLEDTLAEVFAPARVARLDRDTASAGGVEAILDRFRAREIDILVGTQMVTKGHDVPGVTLVGVILADHSLAFPDFRAAERTFQLISQVSGRAGRGSLPGRVVLQTFQPEHPAVRRAAAHDYLGFYEAELRDRRELGYAPFSRLVAVRADAADEERARAAIEALGALAAAHPSVRAHRVALLGPAPAPIARLRGRFRYRLMLRSGDRAALRAVALTLVRRIEEGLSPARASVDIDPVSML
ncbi:MAG: primosomal protein N', partial [Myxococcales bacterium]|nr:primosomal protein N' [Myxococcales bacterium]